MIIQNNFNIGLYKILKTRQNFERDEQKKYLVSAVVADNQGLVLVTEAVVKAY